MLGISHPYAKQVSVLWGAKSFSVLVANGEDDDRSWAEEVMSIACLM
jgi:hypothetical protein